MSGVLRPRDRGTASPSVTWSWGEAAALVLAAYVAGHLIRILLQDGRTSPIDRVVGRAVLELVWIVVIVAWLRLRRLGWTAAFGRPVRAWPEIRDGAVFGAILYGVVALAVALPISWLLGLGSGRTVRAPEPLPTALDALGWALAVALVLLLAPVAEELLFRGILFPGLRARFGLAAGIAGSALAFGLVHYLPGDPVEVVITVAAATGMGVGLAFQYERRGNLVAPLAAHVAFNALGLLILLQT